MLSVWAVPFTLCVLWCCGLGVGGSWCGKVVEVNGGAGVGWGVVEGRLKCGRGVEWGVW